VPYNKQLNNLDRSVVTGISNLGLRIDLAIARSIRRGLSLRFPRNKLTLGYTNSCTHSAALDRTNYCEDVGTELGIIYFCQISVETIVKFIVQTIGWVLDSIPKEASGTFRRLLSVTLPLFLRFTLSERRDIVSMTFVTSPDLIALKNKTEFKAVTPHKTAFSYINT